MRLVLLVLPGGAGGAAGGVKGGINNVQVENVIGRDVWVQGL